MAFASPSPSPQLGIIQRGFGSDPADCTVVSALTEAALDDSMRELIRPLGLLNYKKSAQMSETPL